jgi:NAD(P)-dependent dehydrogenase (short-subunit alcohol dehydrogenase family)
VTSEEIVVPSTHRFGGKTAIVTGAGSGIGRATAIQLATEGAAVACLDVVVDSLDETVEALATLGGKAVAFTCDVTDEDQVRRTVDQAASQLGRPSVLCNVAGIGGFEHTTDLSLERWNRMLAVNLTGPFLTARSTLPYLLDGGGSIVNVASTAGLIGSAYSAAYCSSKGGVVMLTKALANEYAHRGVRVNAVAPGGVDTPLLKDFGLPEGADPKLLLKIMSKMGYASPAQIASAILFLASEESGYTTGAILPVDGGITS